MGAVAARTTVIAYEDFDPPPPPGKNATPDTTHTFRKYRDWTPAQRDEARATSETPPAIRFKTPLDGETVAYDVVRGEMRWQNRDIPADPVLLKRDGYPTYHLAVVVDDHAMAITHIMRAVEWIPNLPIHALLYDAFGWERPVMVPPAARHAHRRQEVLQAARRFGAP